MGVFQTRARTSSFIVARISYQWIDLSRNRYNRVKPLQPGARLNDRLCALIAQPFVIFRRSNEIFLLPFFQSEIYYTRIFLLLYFKKYVAPNKRF